ncbi:hypothetical protein [Paenibacillus sp. B-A-8]
MLDKLHVMKLVNEAVEEVRIKTEKRKRNLN